MTKEQADNLKINDIIYRISNFGNNNYAIEEIQVIGRVEFHPTNIVYYLKDIAKNTTMGQIGSGIIERDFFRHGETAVNYIIIQLDESVAELRDKREKLITKYDKYTKRIYL
jgi:hypothetical protein